VSTLPVSVIVPTIGRRELLEKCLQSLLACRPRADDIVVVDQSHGAEVESVVAALGVEAVRRIECTGSGIARAMNTGLAEADHDTVFVTHDDCRVAEDWIAVGARLAAATPGAIITGRVLPPDDSRYVPSTKADPERHDYTGRLTSGILYPANMIASRRAIQDLGGFDERRTFNVAAEDNDLCYRWLVAGRPFFYEPELLVWHHDWRTPEQLVRTHIAYARGQGAFYAKHLAQRDFRVLPLLRWDLSKSLRTTARGLWRHEPRWQDPYREMFVWLLVGLAEGGRESWTIERARRQAVRAAS
jgi:GT2 family glycosyltransferase